MKRICFVTGTRAEFGLMESTLSAIQRHPKLKLQIIATGMHLSRLHGHSLKTIKANGWKIDATVPWSAARTAEQSAISTGKATAAIAMQLAKLESDVVLVAGDRVEAFAAATAGHLSGKIVAHVHGGDRALGQVDDSLRHAITKLAHIHFPATAKSRSRILKLGEDAWRVHLVGSPGIDGLTKNAAPSPLPRHRYALLVLHPTDGNQRVEEQRARLVLKSVKSVGFDQIVIVYPNNDPGSAGIIRVWEKIGDGIAVHRDLPRSLFLGLMRDAAVLVGNSSSGIIEAASFGTPVVDIGDRQAGRERSGNCVQLGFSASGLEAVFKRIWRGGNPIRYPARNVYGGNGTAKRIASVLAAVSIDSRLQKKLIAY